jgi:uncharacterized protein (DUF849 family)
MYSVVESVRELLRERVKRERKRKGRHPTMLLKAALNGARVPAEHPALPLLPGQLARAGSAAVAAGAGALHIHVRAPTGKETLSAGPLADTLQAVRAACPGIPVGISTGAWIEPDPERRQAAVRAWDSLPDFASVNFHEPGATPLARLLLDRGVGVEAGLDGAAAAELLLASGLVHRCLRVMLEPQAAELAAAEATVAQIEARLESLKGRVPLLLHGTGPTAWPLLLLARNRGYDTRIGLEDTLLLPDGRRAADNTELVATARALLQG